MVLTFCEESRFKVRSDIDDTPLRSESEPYPKIKVIVVNDEKMVGEGKAYCRFPPPPQG